MSNDPQNKLFQTNNYSIVSKYSCVKSGYQRDAVLEKFMETWLRIKSCKRTPLIDRGYAARMMSIDWIVGRSIKFDGVDCFIILGAGFDFLPFRHGSFGHCSWIELDLPEVVSTKSKFVQTHSVLGDGEELIEVKKGIFRSTSSRYHLVECDLRNSEMLTSSLRQVFSSIRTKNVAILNEVCLCYIDLNENRRILSTVIDAVRQFVMRIYYIGYEQYKPHGRSPFSDVMSEHFSLMSYPLKHFPTSKQLRQLFLEDLNFNHLTITPIHNIYHTALQEDRDTFIEAYLSQPFDEYEELSLYLSHYALVTGVLILRDPLMDSTGCLGAGDKEELAEGFGEMTLRGTDGSIDFIPSELERYGHVSCIIEGEAGSNSLLISGGFGSSPGKKNISHRKLNDCVVIKTNSQKSDEIFHMKLIGTENIDPGQVRLDRMHGQLVSLGSNRLFFNGGRQSPNKPPNNLNTAFIARLIDDNELELMYPFQQTSEFVRWRHKVCAFKNSDQFIQVGGLSVFDYVDPIILWDLSADKLGAAIVRCTNMDLFRRHSFAMDSRDRTTLFIMGGLQTSDLTKDRPVDADSNTILWDTRQGKPQAMSYDCALGYGSSVHFVNDYQLLKIGGISTKTGLAENTIQLLDIRNKKYTPVAEDVLPLADKQMILCNTGFCHSKEAREIITTGGGGNYFTFGTRFNKSHLVYKYT